MELKESVKKLPDSPGVYLMLDSDGVILYIGKARNLRKRVSSYFGAARDSRPQVSFLMAKVCSVQFTVTDTEKEALLLENTLIKQHRPRYNLNLKDDKTYFSLRIDLGEKFPRFTVVRKISRDKARYFGPYVSASSAREVLRQLQRLFPLRHYPLKSCMGRSRPCLYHQIGQCCAPCHGMITPDAYNSLVEGAVLFMEGNGGALIAGFRRRMREASEATRYEEAARWRDLLKAIDTTLERQKVVGTGGNADVIGIARKEEHLTVAVIFIRNGSISGSSILHCSGEIGDAAALTAFIQRYYDGERQIPDEILLPLEPDDGAILLEWLTELKGKKVRLHYPRRGAKLDMVALAVKNAQAALLEKSEAERSISSTLEELQEKLSLKALPVRIECYDISTMQGRYSVGSGVVFTDGMPDRARYRRYRIRSIQGQDDFAMLKEVFARRFSPGRIEAWGLPDLVVVDGGIGQLNSAMEIMRGLGMDESISLVSLAKSRVVGDGKGITVERSDERVFLPGRRNPVRFRQDSASLKLLAAIRDEAHRFAIEYHRNLREKGGLRSILRDMPGIGPQLERLLLARFGSIEGIRNATVDDLAEVAGIGRRLAAKISDRLDKGAEG